MAEAYMAADASPDSQRSARDLLLTAATIVHRRRAQGGYTGLTPVAADQLVNALTGIATGDHRFADVRLADAVDLAHRLIDDDNPELSPLWARLDVGGVSDEVAQRPTTARERVGTRLSDPRDLPDDGLAQGPMLGVYITPPIGGWR